MRVLQVLWLFPILAAAQANRTPDGALLKGVILERDAQAASGQFSVRAADNQVFRYRFDPKTYVERDGRSIDVASLKPGDQVEVLSDKMPEAALRYALTVHVVASPAPARPDYPGRTLRMPRQPLGMDELIAPVGNLSYSGVVSRLSDARLVLHTPDKGDQVILLRKDTRYVDNGQMVDSAALKPNMRVFVRAGKSLYDEIEAYQVVWGSILQPK